MRVARKFTFFSLIVIIVSFTCINVSAQTVVNFNCGSTTWTVPACVTSITLNVQGAQGGGTNGGNGAVLNGPLAVTPGQVLQIAVGCQPTGITGGSGGGGAGQSATGAGNSSLGGGGASSISIGGTPVVVAGGGGGQGGGDTDGLGGDGGCPNGVSGVSPYGQGGFGGTTTAGGAGGPPWIASGNPGSNGSLGLGGAGGSDPCYNLGPGGGGGGGYYGGGGGGSDCFGSTPLGGGGGGGGSSLIPGGFTCGATNTGNGIITITYTSGSAVATAANTGPYCVGQTIQLSSTGGGTYSWNGPGGYTSAIQNPTLSTATTAMSGTYTVTVNAGGGCAATATTSVLVNPSPTVTVNSPSICVNGSTTLNAGGATTYNWSPGTGLSGTTGASVTANPIVTTTYTIVGTTGTCTSSITSIVTVNPLPIVTVNSATICPGSTTTLTASGASTYTWSPGTGLSSTNGASVSASPTVATTYTITGTSVAGCTATATSTVTIGGAITPTVNSATICSGNSVILTASGATTYTWSPGTGLSSTTGASVTANPIVTTTYTVVGASGACTGTVTSVVTVNASPVVTIGSNSPVCVNQTLNLTSSGGTGYSWSGPNIFSSVQQNPSITGVTTPATGVYTVIVTGANTCTNTATVNVQINPLPIVAVTGATVCVGATINLTATGGTGYSWSGPNVYTSNSQNPSITNATAVMAGNYVVVVTDANGCSNGSTAQVTINPSLVIAASNNSPICQNTTLNLTSTTGVSWTWSGPLGYTSTQQNPTLNNAQPNVSGIYTVTGTDANGCQGTATTNVTVNPLPTITTTSATICVGTSATITAAGVLTFTWNTAATGSSLTLSPSTTTSYTVVGTDNNNCVNFATTSITVNPLPVVTVNSGVICIGNTTTLTANGAVNYSWNPATGLSSSIGSPVTANPTSTTFYTVTGTDNNLCVNTATTSVTVNPLPIISVASTAICVGNTTVLNATGANAYSWSPTTGLSGGSGASVTANPGTTSVYTVTGTNITGCQSAATLTVTVNPLPLVVVSPQTTSGCAPVCVNFVNTASGTGTCLWNFGNGSSSASCAANNCFTAQGSYQVSLTLTDNNGCINSSSAFVTVYPVPNADFNVTPQPTTILDNLIHFYDVSSGANITTWNWNLGLSGSNTTLQNPTYLYGDTGSYAISLLVISDMGCRDSIMKMIKIDDDFMIYVPNAFTPNTDGVNDIFLAKGEGIREFKMFIYDRWGMLVFSSDDITKGWNGVFHSRGNDIVQEDVYIWKIELKNTKGKKQQMTGHVSLLK